MTDELKGATSDANESQVADDAKIEGGVKPEGELEKLPLHLHSRGKELVAEKNALKGELAEFRQFGSSPEVLAEKLRRLEVLESRLYAEETPTKKTLPTQDELKSKSEKEYARAMLEDLAPEIKDVKALKEVIMETRQLLEGYKTAIEDVAWEQTEELAVEMDIEPDALARLVIPIIKSDAKLLRKYNSGKSDQAVKDAVKILQTKVGGKPKTDIDKRAEQIKKGTETSSKVPKTHAPGTAEVTVKSDKPTTWAEAAKRAQARIDRMGT